MPRRPAALAFLALVLGVPLGQAGWELARGARVQALDVFTAAPTEARLRTFEDELRRASFLREELAPRYDGALSRLFGRGNEKVLQADDGWLFYVEDLDYVTRRRHFADRAADAVIDVRAQLAAQGADLLVVPVEPKAVVEWARLGAPARPAPPAGARFRARLATAGVHVVELPEDLEYLPRDTHWTPASMQVAARETAARALARLGAPPQPTVEWRAEPALVRGDGDLMGMLTAPPRLPGIELEVEQILDAATGGFFHADREADVLLLGDSFTRVFGDAELGLGRGAGFDAHLAREMASGLDVIAIAGGSARAVREALARRPGGAAGKRLVIWQLSLRDLVVDAERWARVDLSGSGGGELVPAGEWLVDAELVARTVAPPGFDYATLLAVHEYRVLASRSGEPRDGALWVAHLVLREFDSTEAAAFAIGDRHRMRLVPVEERYDLERTSWVDDLGAGARIWFAADLERTE